jgi:hypothetical protein
MSKKPDFVKFAQHIKQGKELMEPIRIRWLCAFLAAAFCAVVGASVSLLAFSVSPNDPAPGYMSACISFILFIVLALRSASLGEQLNDQFNRWRETGVQMLDSEASFAAGRGLSQADFDSSGLNNATYNRYSCSSMLSVGRSQSSYIYASDERTETYYETEYYTDSQGHQQSRQVQKTRQVVVKIFSGLLLKHPVRLPKGGALMLRSRRVGLPNGWHQLHVASPELHKHYAIGATDAFIGHRTLTPSFMVRLWDYSSTCRYLPSYAYRDGWLYLLIPEFWLSFGRQPGKWRVVSNVSLQQCMDECHASIDFVRNSVQKLVPVLNEEPILKVAKS